MADNITRVCAQAEIARGDVRQQMALRATGGALHQEGDETEDNRVRIDEQHRPRQDDQAEEAAPDRAQELELARSYFTNAWPKLADRTRSSIAITLSVLLDAFLTLPDP